MALAALRSGDRRGSLARGRRLGRLVQRVAPLRRRVAWQNLEAAFPEMSESRRRETLNRVYENFGCVLADFARAGRRPVEPIDESIRVDNLEAVEAAQRAGRGGLLLTAHYGNWEALGAAVAQAGFPVTMLGARQRNLAVERLFDELRTARGARTTTRRRGLRPVVSALRRGEFVATLADQDGGRDGFFVPFLGRTASVQAGVFQLAARLGTPVITGFSYREGDRWHARLDDPVFPDPAAGEGSAADAEARRLAEVYTRRVEEAVQRRPDHWFWFHRRWKTRPTGRDAPGKNPGLPPAGRR